MDAFWQRKWEMKRKNIQEKYWLDNMLATPTILYRPRNRQIPSCHEFDAFYFTLNWQFQGCLTLIPSLTYKMATPLLKTVTVLLFKFYLTQTTQLCEPSQWSSINGRMNFVLWTEFDCVVTTFASHLMQGGNQIPTLINEHSLTPRHFFLHQLTVTLTLLEEHDWNLTPE